MKPYLLLKAGLLLCILLCVRPNRLLAQTAPEAPQLEFALELRVSIAPALVIGETPNGIRRVIPITGGTFSGPTMKGTILSGGADWQMAHKEGVVELNAIYTLQTDDGTLIYVNNKGIRVATPEVAQRLANNEQVPASEYYFRAIPTFEAPPGKYEWLSKAVFVSRGIRNANGVIIQVWKVL
ncbi:DUF3237 domain-containing protein [Fibrella sp. HMF5335]|uniref:UPF0311 protein J2I47_18675 n=1 Tax=Fibrella rubiginis TaxID=2817060 RepID=A0A939GGI3_9BACT|nr:DUF3237 domain-containing protein [Fibrella rubiginis]MBO0938584.1 DUF3237 domain-containing protein [Fibrella rubiginis]